MVWIIDVIKLFFEKNDVEGRKLYLTKDQKRKYSTQYKRVMIRFLGLSFILISAIVDSIYRFFSTHSFIYVGLIVLFFREFIRWSFDTKEEILLIDERIEKREKKNRKQKVLIDG